MHKNNFDLLRFLFALIVVLRHIIDLSQNKGLLSLEPFFDSYASVTGFFIISGHLIWHSYTRSRNLKDYLLKRAKRLMPAYIAFICIASVLLCLVSTLSPQEYFTNKGLYKYVFCNLLFMNFLQPCLPGVFTSNWQCAVNGALWTIKVEIMFYLVVPILHKIVNRLSIESVSFSIVSLYILSILYKYFLSRFDTNISYLLSKQLPGFFSYFVSGVSFNYFYNFYKRHGHILLFLSIIILITERLSNIELLTPFAFSMVIFQFAYVKDIATNFAKNIDLSYGLYIYHFTVIQIFVAYNLFETMSPFIVSLLIIITTLALSSLSWRYLEKPFLKRRPL